VKGCLTLFGTSGSLGVPVVGCRCEVCLSSSLHNKRLRPCNLIKIKEKNFLLDAGPDFRTQALQYHVQKLDGLILTHTHFDHIAGLDDLRVFSFLTNQPLPILCSEATKKELMHFFFYMFQEKVKQKFTFITFDRYQHHIDFCGIRFNLVFYEQIGMQVTGFRIGDLSYVTDIKTYDKTLIEMIEGSKTLVIGALEWNPTRAHLGLHDVIELASKAKVDACYITHIGHELDHHRTNENLPSFVQLAYDGLSLEFTL
jgi:phosphoribosyl 1,2-cyclic phosphate phosphodiesterase